ncbi:hypothetical protein DUZ99_08400 [Xylanibacillus composti]|uniref:PepSY domain-containing protein n=1 Tax=Xylanibacillus composti TaxID=1572762 RepID=A0A8J4H7M0_9BACL|nr:hypothetical protein [Xylanibacillus composti]MDT9725014.1 hypothetical protein [Xylanibacillus composti]GIQ71307.1 hypothetical protein XYCOK13_41310 [Xylanibacillus composti]
MNRSRAIIAAACMTALLWTSGVFNATAQAPADELSMPAGVSEQQMPESAEPAQEPLGPYAGSLPQALDAWLKALSTEPRFQEWAHAARSISPIGPGTHGWVVMLSREQQEIGYLVVHADETGQLVLSEYGVGPHALFSMNVLKQQLLWNGLAERAGIMPGQLSTNQVRLHYWSPAEALFVIETVEGSYTVNAKNGEWYELEPALQLVEKRGDISQKVPAVRHVHEGHAIMPASIRSHHLPEFDAFERTLWLDGQELAPESFSELAAILDRGNRVIAATKAFDEVWVTWPIVGYHLWDGEIPYLIVLDEGERYVPFDPMTFAYYADVDRSNN